MVCSLNRIELEISRKMGIKNFFSEAVLLISFEIRYVLFGSPGWEGGMKLQNIVYHHCGSSPLFRVALFIMVAMSQKGPVTT